MHCTFLIMHCTKQWVSTLKGLKCTHELGIENIKSAAIILINSKSCVFYIELRLWAYVIS